MLENSIFPYVSEEKFQKDYNIIQEIYEHIVDDESREIYAYRLLLSLTDDMAYMRKLILMTEEGKLFEKFLSRQKSIYIYGAGVRGQRLIGIFPNMKWTCYIDQICEGTCNGLRIIKPQKLRVKDDEIILVTNYTGYDEIVKKLLSMNIEKTQIICMNDFEKKVQEKQYFEERCVKYFKRTDGAFIDAGCYDGRDCLKFMHSKFGGNRNIYAFEPDNCNFKRCKKILYKYNNIQVYDCGLSDEVNEALFLSNGGEKARVVENGNCYVKLDTIDHLMQGRRVGYIKMDIEGSEKAALVGAKIHIKEDRPNMMISIYHKMEDVIEIPKLLLSMNPNYRFALGHYAIGSAGDTVLYVFE